ncbi:MAG TPA: hypothetical protein P5233_14730 [Candidatus Paceibacterota bacterium]|nr:hypothetical protein [Candidatus Paceibacterota bacterium]
MASLHEYKRRVVLPACVVGLALLYGLVYLPLAREARAIDDPVEKAWKKLAAALGQTNATTLDFLFITNQLNETRQAIAHLAEARKAAEDRFQLPGPLRERLAAPFQLVEYQNELSKYLDDLSRRAKEQKITVDPLVFSGFPEHTADMQDPAMLWAALAFTGDLLDTALRCKVTALHALDARVQRVDPMLAGSTGRWVEIPIEVEFTAPAASATSFVQSLPRRVEEILAAQLPEAPPGKSPLLIENLIIRKQTPEQPEEVRIWLRAIGFVRRD